jgi:hypothetical protein
VTLRRPEKARAVLQDVVVLAVREEFRLTGVEAGVPRGRSPRLDPTSFRRLRELLGDSESRNALALESAQLRLWLGEVALAVDPGFMQLFVADRSGLDPFVIWGLPTAYSALAVTQAAALQLEAGEREREASGESRAGISPQLSYAANLPILRRWCRERAERGHFPTARTGTASRRGPAVADIVALAAFLHRFPHWRAWPQLMEERPLLALFAPQPQRRDANGFLFPPIPDPAPRPLRPDVLAKAAATFDAHAWTAKGARSPKTVRMAYEGTAGLLRLLACQVSRLIRRSMAAPAAQEQLRLLDGFVDAFARPGNALLGEAGWVDGSQVPALDFLGVLFYQLSLGVGKNLTMRDSLVAMPQLHRLWERCVCVYAWSYRTKHCVPATRPYSALSSAPSHRRDEAPWLFPTYMRLIRASVVGDAGYDTSGCFVERTD